MTNETNKIVTMDDAREYYEGWLKEVIKAGADKEYESFRHTFKPLKASVDWALENPNGLKDLIEEIEIWKGKMIMNNPQFKNNFYRDEVMLNNRHLVDLTANELFEFGKSRYNIEVYDDEKNLFDRHFPTILQAHKNLKTENDTGARKSIETNLSPKLQNLSDESFALTQGREDFDKHFEETYVDKDVLMVYMQSNPELDGLLDFTKTPYEF